MIEPIWSGVRKAYAFHASERDRPYLINCRGAHAMADDAMNMGEADVAEVGTGAEEDGMEEAEEGYSKLSTSFIAHTGN